MLIFTYNEYLDCIQNKKLQKLINKENKRQKIEENNQKIDEKLIEEKENIVNLINKSFKIKSWNVTKENMQKCTNQSKTNKAIYKLKGKEVYFMIKLQKEPDYHLVYTILRECIDFIEKWKIESKKIIKLPILIPIIIYTGKKKWNIKTNINIKCTNFRRNGINLSYNIIDLSKKSN